MTLPKAESGNIRHLRRVATDKQIINISLQNVCVFCFKITAPCFFALCLEHAWERNWARISCMPKLRCSEFCSEIQCQLTHPHAKHCNTSKLCIDELIKKSQKQPSPAFILLQTMRYTTPQHRSRAAKIMEIPSCLEWLYSRHRHVEEAPYLNAT